MEFHFETNYNQKGFTVMARALRRTIRRKHSRRSHLFGWCVAAFGLLLTAADRMLQEPWTFRNTLTCGVVLILLVTLLAEDRTNAFFARRRMLPGTETAACVFTEDGYTSSTAAATTEFRYEAVQRICETREYFVFLLGRQHGQIYDKATLTGGTVDEFRTFISEKTGKPVEYIK